MTRRDVKPDQQLVFFPTCGPRRPDGSWLADLHGWVHKPGEDSLLRRKLLGLVSTTLGLAPAETETALFRSRAWPFLVDNKRGQEVTVRLGGRDHMLGRSSANGHFVGAVALPADAVAGWHAYEALLPAGDDRRFIGRVCLVEDDGLSVVSDIDDTVKVSEVRDRRALLANTFLRDFRPVAGMAALYQAWADRGAAFHFVSASPWQLFRPLFDFLEAAGFPPATYHLKSFRLKDRTARNLAASPEATKRKAIEPLFAGFPRRRFVLVGDSGEIDPEIYGALAREHPGRVERILIRDVTDDDEARYREAFRDLPDEAWQVFREPQEVS